MTPLDPPATKRVHRSGRQDLDGRGDRPRPGRSPRPRSVPGMADRRRRGARQTSRASPATHSASPRLGLTSTSRTTSPYRSSRVRARPAACRPGGSGCPVAVPVSRSSSPEQSMPLLTDAHLLGALDPRSRAARRPAGRPGCAGRARCCTPRTRPATVLPSPQRDGGQREPSARGCRSHR